MAKSSRLALLMMGLIGTYSSIASAASFPRGCEVTGFGFTKNFLVMNEQGAQTFYLIQNRSNKQIQLERYETRPNIFMTPKLETKIAPERWAAFASDEKNTYFQCQTSGEEKLVISCRDVLDICQYPRVKFALSNMGSYWVSTDKPQKEVIQDSTKKGIFLHW